MYCQFGILKITIEDFVLVVSYTWRSGMYVWLPFTTVGLHDHIELAQTVYVCTSLPRSSFPQHVRIQLQPRLGMHQEDQQHEQPQPSHTTVNRQNILQLRIIICIYMSAPHVKTTFLCLLHEYIVLHTHRHTCTTHILLFTTFVTRIHTCTHTHNTRTYIHYDTHSTYIL